MKMLIILDVEVDDEYWKDKVAREVAEMVNEAGELIGPIRIATSDEARSAVLAAYDGADLPESRRTI